MSNVKLIRLKENTYKRLESYGKMGEHFDGLVNRLLDDYEKLKGQTQTEKQISLIVEPKVEEIAEGPHELWTAKYRPKKLEDIVGNEATVNQLKNYVKLKNIPNLLLYGPVGTGKTSAALCIAKEILPEGYGWLRFNAAELKKEDVRGRISNLAKRGALTPIQYKICIIDECEKMTGDVDSLLRTLMEEYSNNIRFILVCNDINHKAISQPIKSRCTILEFKLLSEANIIRRLSYIATKESISINPEKLDEIAKESTGDCRKAVSLLHDYFISQEDKVHAKL